MARAASPARHKLVSKSTLRGPGLARHRQDAGAGPGQARTTATSLRAENGSNGP